MQCCGYTHGGRRCKRRAGADGLVCAQHARCFMDERMARIEDGLGGLLPLCSMACVAPATTRKRLTMVLFYHIFKLHYCDVVNYPEFKAVVRERMFFFRELGMDSLVEMLARTEGVECVHHDRSDARSCVRCLARAAELAEALYVRVCPDALRIVHEYAGGLDMSRHKCLLC